MEKTEKSAVMIGEQTYPLIIIRKKIKNTYIRAGVKGEIIVSTSPFTPREFIDELILKNQKRVLNLLERQKERAIAPDKIAYSGKIYTLKMLISEKFAYKITDETIIIYRSENLDKEKAVDAFYKVEAEALFTERFENCVNTFKRYFPLPEVSFSIRKMKSRYGTCYYRKNHIILNLYLMKYDMECIDYVIYHELSHFIVHNHSQAFYKVFQTVIPYYKEIKIRLNKF